MNSQENKITFNRFKRKTLHILYLLTKHTFLNIDQIRNKKLTKVILKTDQVYDERLIKGHEYRILCLVQLNENKIVSAGNDNLIKIWDLVEGTCCMTLEKHSSSVKFLLRLSYNTIASSCGNNILVWDVLKGTCTREIKNPSICILCLFRYNSNLIFIGSKHCTITIVDCSDGTKNDKVIDFNYIDISTYSILKLNKLGDLAYGTSNGLIIRNNGSKIEYLKGHQNSVTSLLKLSNKHIVSGCKNGLMKFWDIETKNCYRTIKAHDDQIYCLVYLNKSLLTGSIDNKIKIWRVSDGTIKGNISSFDSIKCVIKINLKQIAYGYYSSIQVKNIEYI